MVLVLVVLAVLGASTIRPENGASTARQSPLILPSVESMSN